MNKTIFVVDDDPDTSITIKHILENGDTIDNNDLEELLISKYKLGYKQQEFFERTKTKDESIEEGYVFRNKDIGFSNEEHNNPKE